MFGMVNWLLEESEAEGIGQVSLDFIINSLYCISSFFRSLDLYLFFAYFYIFSLSLF
jgi:hypothetical protein